MSVLWHFLKWAIGAAGPEVWTTDAERECLERYAAGKRRVVEIGVWHGGTSRILRRAMAHNGIFYAVDPYEPGRLGFSIPRIVARSEIARVSNGRVVWVRSTGVRATTSKEIQAAGPLDFVFIDAAQSYDALHAEWQAWAPLVAESGIVALHDTLRMNGDPTPEQTSVAYARDFIFQDRRFQILEAVDTLSVLQRRASLCHST
jgi:predicted O-methyltransferase YrrM